MPGMLATALGHSTRCFIACLLLVAVSLYGLSATLVELLGARHMHVELAQAQASSPEGPMAGWQDPRRATVSISSVAHRHTHSVFERHHHAADDAGVVSLDGHGHDGGLSDEAGSVPGGSASLVLALAGSESMPALRLPPFAWELPAAARVTSRDPERIDKPPKA